MRSFIRRVQSAAKLRGNREQHRDDSPSPPPDPLLPAGPPPPPPRPPRSFPPQEVSPAAQQSSTSSTNDVGRLESTNAEPSRPRTSSSPVAPSLRSQGSSQSPLPPVLGPRQVQVDEEDGLTLLNYQAYFNAGPLRQCLDDVPEEWVRDGVPLPRELQQFSKLDLKTSNGEKDRSAVNKDKNQEAPPRQRVTAVDSPGRAKNKRTGGWYNLGERLRSGNKEGVDKPKDQALVKNRSTPLQQLDSLIAELSSELPAPGSPVPGPSAPPMPPFSPTQQRNQPLTPPAETRQARRHPGEVRGYWMNVRATLFDDDDGGAGSDGSSSTCSTCTIRPAQQPTIAPFSQDGSGRRTALEPGRLPPARRLPDPPGFGSPVNEGYTLTPPLAPPLHALCPLPTPTRAPQGHRRRRPYEDHRLAFPQLPTGGFMDNADIMPAPLQVPQRAAQGSMSPPAFGTPTPAFGVPTSPPYAPQRRAQGSMSPLSFGAPTLPPAFSATARSPHTPSPLGASTPSPRGGPATTPFPAWQPTPAPTPDTEGHRRHRCHRHGPHHCHGAPDAASPTAAGAQRRGVAWAPLPRPLPALPVPRMPHRRRLTIEEKMREIDEFLGGSSSDEAEAGGAAPGPDGKPLEDIPGGWI